MSNYIGEGDRNEHSKQDWMNLRHLPPGTVKEDGDESNGNVEDLAGDFVPVNLFMSVEIV